MINHHTSTYKANECFLNPENSFFKKNAQEHTEKVTVFWFLRSKHYFKINIQNSSGKPQRHDSKNADTSSYSIYYTFKYDLAPVSLNTRLPTESSELSEHTVK